MSCLCEHRFRLKKDFKGLKKGIICNGGEYKMHTWGGEIKNGIRELIIEFSCEYMIKYKNLFEKVKI